MTTYRIAMTKTQQIRMDLPEFKTSSEAYDYISLEFLDWDFVNHFVTPIQAV